MINILFPSMMYVAVYDPLSLVSIQSRWLSAVSTFKHKIMIGTQRTGATEAKKC
jgi:hypothetical protein